MHHLLKNSIIIYEKLNIRINSVSISCSMLAAVMYLWHFCQKVPLKQSSNFPSVVPVHSFFPESLCRTLMSLSLNPEISSQPSLLDIVTAGAAARLGSCCTLFPWPPRCRVLGRAASFLVAGFSSLRLAHAAVSQGPSAGPESATKFK